MGDGFMSERQRAALREARERAWVDAVSVPPFGDKAGDGAEAMAAEIGRQGADLEASHAEVRYWDDPTARTEAAEAALATAREALTDIGV